VAYGWNGSDPAEVGDASDYELGTEYLVNETITITHVRVHTGAGEIGQAGRKARLWTTAGVELAQAALPTDLPTGWSEHELDAPVTRTAGQRVVVSYSTYGNYSALPGALAAGVESADGAVTALASNTATNGNGVFAADAPGTFPTTGSGGSAFYGVDLVYTLGAGGNTAPEITELTAVAAGATVTAAMVVADEETLVGASYRIEWGDGAATTGATSAQHTYTTSGLYAVLAKVTDAGGLSDEAAVAVQVVVPGTELDRLDWTGLRSAVITHAKLSGRYERHQEAEYLTPPGAGLSVAVFGGPDAITPVRTSGLGMTSARVELLARIYHPAKTTPVGVVDARLVAAADDLMYRLTGDFTLNSRARAIDVLGAHGEMLRARLGWLPYPEEGGVYRVADITIPIILNDIHEQVA
jgi:hypothetical protein